MPAYAGSALYFAWIYSGGTVVPSADFRTVTYTPNISLYPETAGADAAELFVAGVKSGQASFTGVMQASGTAISNAFAEGSSGTMIIAPEGTATGKQKITIPAIAMGARYSVPYNDVVELAADFTQNGVRTDSSY